MEENKQSDACTAVPVRKANGDRTSCGTVFMQVIAYNGVIAHIVVIASLCDKIKVRNYTFNFRTCIGFIPQGCDDSDLGATFGREVALSRVASGQKLCHSSFISQFIIGAPPL